MFLGGHRTITALGSPIAPDATGKFYKGGREFRGEEGLMKTGRDLRGIHLILLLMTQGTKLGPHSVALSVHPENIYVWSMKGWLAALYRGADKS
jgi:hypothetical protein